MISTIISKVQDEELKNELIKLVKPFSKEVPKCAQKEGKIDNSTIRDLQNKKRNESHIKKQMNLNTEEFIDISEKNRSLPGSGNYNPQTKSLSNMPR